jgi:hypothetical protein
MRHILLPAAILLAACLAQAGDDYPIKVYPCPRLDPAPTLDGKLADACWQRAPVVSGFTRYNKPERMDVQTSFRVGYDDAHLYFGVHCDEPNAKRLSPTAAGRDTGQVFRGETVEIFVDPRHDHENYHQFAVNLANAFYDSRRFDRTWNCAAKTATRLLPDAWELEAVLPWEAFGLTPKPGMVVGFNVCRDRYAGGAREWSNWAQTKANFHDPVRFGHLVISPTEAQLGRLGAEFRKGDRAGPIRLYGHAGTAARAYLAMARDTLKRLDALLDELAAEATLERSLAAQEEIAERLALARQHVEPYREKLDAAKALDAAAYTRLDIQLHRLERRLRHLLWDARLAALLEDI